MMKMMGMGKTAGALEGLGKAGASTQAVAGTVTDVADMTGKTAGTVGSTVDSMMPLVSMFP